MCCSVCNQLVLEILRVIQKHNNNFLYAFSVQTVELKDISLIPSLVTMIYYYRTW